MAITEQTTTELLDEFRDLNERADDVRCYIDALSLAEALDGELVSGSPLPSQWPHAKELEELRTELAALRKALDDRRTVERWANTHGGTITLDCFANGDVELDIRNGDTGKREFNSSARSIDEAYSAAAEWVRGQL